MHRVNARSTCVFMIPDSCDVINVIGYIYLKIKLHLIYEIFVVFFPTFKIFLPEYSTIQARNSISHRYIILITSYFSLAILLSVSKIKNTVNISYLFNLEFTKENSLPSF